MYWTNEDTNTARRIPQALLAPYLLLSNMDLNEVSKGYSKLDELEE